MIPIKQSSRRSLPLHIPFVCTIPLFIQHFFVRQKTDSDLIIDKTNNHIVLQRDHVGRHVIFDLVGIFHEQKCTITRESFLPSFRDQPSLLL